MKRFAMLAALAALFLGGCGEAMGKEAAEKMVTELKTKGDDLVTKLGEVKDAAGAEKIKGALSSFISLKDKLSTDAVKKLIGEKSSVVTEMVAKVKAAATKLIGNADIKKVLGDLVAKFK